MRYGYGRGFGFRGASPPWPYVGRGRGGLPRCSYPGLAGRVADYGAPWVSPYWSMRTGEEEAGFLKSRADDLRQQLSDIEGRLQELEKKN